MKLESSLKRMTLSASHSLSCMAKETACHCFRNGGRPIGEITTSPTLLFLKELCKNPRTIGALWPSSDKLARCMAEQISRVTGLNGLGEGLIVELGAGSGTVTQALADTLPMPQNRLWAVEQSDKLASMLTHKFPDVNVVQGDARELSRIIPKRQVDVIISCLPLRGFSQKDVRAITEQWHSVLADGGLVVQFTYALWHKKGLLQHGFYEADRHFVWKNFPPARVQILKKNDLAL